MTCVTFNTSTLTQEVADLNETQEALMAEIIAQNTTNEELLRQVVSASDDSTLQLKLLNARTEETFETQLTEEDIND